MDLLTNIIAHILVYGLFAFSGILFLISLVLVPGVFYSELFTEGSKTKRILLSILVGFPVTAIFPIIYHGL